jgi:hypothetical protein
VKRIFFAFALVVVLLGSVARTTAYAHPPKSVELGLNADGSLTVMVGHGVNDPGKHYIYKIVVYVNDTVAVQREYKSQTSAEGMTDTFAIGSKPSGTRIKAEAFCIIMGSLVGTVTIP